jgi:FkbM family methyltransferase
MSTKSAVQHFLKRVGLYDRVKASSAYDFYWRIADPRIIADRSRELAFYRETLSGFEAGDVIFDIGANEGHKTELFLQLGARVVAVEPDDVNQRTLRGRFISHRLTPKPLFIVGSAVSDTKQATTMWIDAPGSAKNTLSRKWVETLREDDRRFGARLHFGNTKTVETTTLEDLIRVYGTPFFIKIDVEGHELSVLRGMKRPVSYLSFEVNLPEFASEGRECANRLHEIMPSGEFNYTADCRVGMSLNEWVTYDDFIRRYETIADNSIEVFWRTNVESTHAPHSVQ